VLHDQATARSLGLARILVFSLAAASRLSLPLWEVCCLSEYRPAGVMRLLGAAWWVPRMTPAGAVVIQALTVGLLLAVAAGARPYRWLAPAACLALTVSEGILRGYGQFPHRYIILLLLAYLLCGFPAADALSLFPPRTRRTTDPRLYQAALVSATLLFCLTYSLTAARRLSSGGLAIYFDDTILCATATRDAELGAAGGWGLWACESVAAAWMLRLGFPLVTLLELLAPLCVFSKPFRWGWIAVMAPFHVGTGLLMGIWFTQNLALFPLLVGGLDPFRRRTGHARDDAQPPDALQETLLPRIGEGNRAPTERRPLAA
jgi:hypothetical protein